MILAGDIGGTNARLAYFEPQNGHFKLVSERVFPSREHSELGEIVCRFLDDSVTRPQAACFGIAASRLRTCPGSSNNRDWPSKFIFLPLC
jgi:glucokinase